MSSSRSSLSSSSHSPPRISDIHVSPVIQSTTSKRFSGPTVAHFGSTDSALPFLSASPTTDGYSLPPPSPPYKPVKPSTLTKCQPPRPPNAFIIYRSEQFKLFKEAKRIGGMLQADLSKLIGDMWAKESEVVRSWFFSQAAMRKAEHAQLYPDYQFKPSAPRKSKPTLYHPSVPSPVVKKVTKKRTPSTKVSKPNGNLKKAPSRSFVSLPLPSMIVPPSPPKISAEPPVQLWKQPTLPHPRYLPVLNRSVSDFSPQSHRGYETSTSRGSVGEVDQWSNIAGESRRARFGGSEYGSGESIATGWIGEEVKSAEQSWSSSIHVSPTQVVQPVTPRPVYRLPHEMNTHYLSPQESPYSHSRSSTQSYFDPRSASTSSTPYSPIYTPVSPHEVPLLPHQQHYQYLHLQVPHLEKLEIQQPVPRYAPWNPVSPTADWNPVPDNAPVNP